MTYKISGITNDSAAVYVIDEATNILEMTTNITTGNYEISPLSSGTKTVIARSADGNTLSFGAIPVVSGTPGIGIKNIYSGIISLFGEYNSSTPIIGPTTSKYAIFHTGDVSIGGNLDSAGVALTISGTEDHLTLNAYANVLNATSPVLATYSLVEFMSGVIRYQTGAVDMRSLASTNVSIIPVNSNNTIAYLPGMAYNGTRLCMITGLTDNTLTITRAGTNGSLPVWCTWSLIEFENGIIESKQDGTLTMSNLTSTASISAVDTNRSVVFYKGRTRGSGSLDNYHAAAIELQNSTTIKGTRIATYSNDTIYFTVVQFATGILKSIQRGYTESSTTQNITINEVNPAKTVIITGGYTVADNGGQYLKIVRLKDSTTLEVTGFSGYNGGVSWQIVEFN